MTFIIFTQTAFASQYIFTIISHITHQSTYGLGYVFLGGGINPHIMPGGGGFGGMENKGKIDGVYSQPNNQKYLIGVNMSLADASSDVCDLLYNALTKQVTWVERNPYQPDKKYPSVQCQLRVFPNHVFLLVGDGKFSSLT